MAAEALADYARLWKLATLLIASCCHYDAPDWDIPISVIMAVLAYLAAP